MTKTRNPKVFKSGDWQSYLIAADQLDEAGEAERAAALRRRGLVMGAVLRVVGAVREGHPAAEEALDDGISFVAKRVRRTGNITLTVRRLAPPPWQRGEPRWSAMFTASLLGRPGYVEAKADQAAVFEVAYERRPAVPRSWKVGIKTSGDREWAYNGQRWPTETQARDAGASLSWRWAAVTEWEVQPSDDEPNQPSPAEQPS